MFNMEQAITAWRRQMLAAGIKAPVPLEELESHLREEIDKQIQSGISEQLAFETAVERIGYPSQLKNEFKKTGCAKDDRSWKLLRMGLIGAAITPILNLIGLFVFHRSSSIIFSDQWWSAWFPSYSVWLTFTIIGLGQWMRQRKTSNA